MRQHSLVLCVKAAMGKSVCVVYSEPMLCGSCLDAEELSTVGNTLDLLYFDLE